MKVTVTPIAEEEVERRSGPVPKWAVIARRLLNEKGPDLWHTWTFESPMRQETVRTGLKRALQRLKLEEKYRVGVRRRAEDRWRERLDVLFVGFFTREDG